MGGMLRGQMTRFNFEGRGSSRHSSTTPLDGRSICQRKNLRPKMARRVRVSGVLHVVRCKSECDKPSPGPSCDPYIRGLVMHVPANQPEFSAAVNPAVEELNRIVDQAEALLRSLGAEGGEAAEAVRQRVT